jgi:hypothetical protein
MSAALARAIQYALRPHIFGNPIDRAQVANALYSTPPKPAPEFVNPFLVDIERKVPAGWRLTPEARERVIRVSEAPDRAARRRLLRMFRDNPVRTFEQEPVE